MQDIYKHTSWVQSKYPLCHDTSIVEHMQTLWPGTKTLSLWRANQHMRLAWLTWGGIIIYWPGKSQEVVPDNKFIGPTWGPSGADRTKVGTMLAPWTLLSGVIISMLSIMNQSPSLLQKCLINMPAIVCFHMSFKTAEICCHEWWFRYFHSHFTAFGCVSSHWVIMVILNTWWYVSVQSGPNEIALIVLNVWVVRKIITMFFRENLTYLALLDVSVLPF